MTMKDWLQSNLRTFSKDKVIREREALLKLDEVVFKLEIHACKTPRHLTK